MKSQSEETVSGRDSINEPPNACETLYKFGLRRVIVTLIYAYTEDLTPLHYEH
jgi:hypothetical protein